MTIKQIAALAQVSPTAVSFVLNDRPGVSPEKREEIKALLLAHGYQLKRRDATLAPKHIKFVKLRTYYQNDEFATNVLNAIEESIASYGFQLSITSLAPKQGTQALENLEGEQIDGIIFLATSFTKDYLKVSTKLPFPAVYIDYEEQLDSMHQINTINADNYQAAYTAVRHLSSLGHKRIGYLKSSQETHCLARRFLYFKQHMATLGLSFHPDMVIAIDVTANAVEQQVAQALQSLRDMPSAFIAENDMLAANCIYALHSLGFSIPQDISVLGFDNAPIANLLMPKLSTIDVNMKELAAAAVDRLVMLMQSQRAPTHINVGVNLIKRNSTKLHLG